MKRIIFTSILLTFGVFSNAQIKIPHLSVNAQIEQTVGLTDIEVEYVRPAKRGRVIFGDLVPFGKLWRTGANENTTISFSEDVIINGKTLSKGKYALYTKPSASQWTIFFYKETKNWGLPKVWNDSNVVLETNVPVSEYNTENEYFTIRITPIDTNDGTINLLWDKTEVVIPFRTLSHQQAMKNIAEGLNENSPARDYFNAGAYYLSSGEDPRKALEYVDKSIDMMGDAPYYVLRQKSLILAKLGKRKDAIKIAEQSLKKSQEAGNNDYIKLNEDSLKEWRR